MMPRFMSIAACLACAMILAVTSGSGDPARAQSQGFCKEDCERACRQKGLSERCLAVCATRRPCDTSIRLGNESCTSVRNNCRRFCQARGGAACLPDCDTGFAQCMRTGVWGGYKNRFGGVTNFRVKKRE
jgi:hypothetical protein